MVGIAGEMKLKGGIIVCECLKIEEILVIAGQLLPKENEVTDGYKDIQFNYCPVCGTDLSTLEEEI